MATDAEIREWARGEGIEVPPRGRLAPTFRQQYDDAHPGAVDDDGQALDAGTLQSVETAGEQPPGLPSGMTPAPAETAPTSPHRPRLQLLGGGRKKEPKAPKSRRRVSLESTIANAWELLAGAAARTGLSPTARVLGMQAPVAGVILEDALRGTVVDRVLQPIARMGDKTGSLYALMAPPLIVSALSMHPERGPMLLPILRGALREWVMVAGPALRKRQRAEEKAAADLDLPDGQTVDDLVESWLEMFFTDPPAPGVPHAA